MQRRPAFEMLDENLADAAGAGNRRNGRDGEANEAASGNNVEECRGRYRAQSGGHRAAH